MDTLADRIAKLPAEKRERFLRQLEAQQAQSSHTPTEQGPVTGPVPLLPAQKQLLTMLSMYRLNVNVFNICTLLEIDEAIDARLARRAVHHLLLHHDALRIRLHKQDTTWQQWIDEPGEDPPFHTYDFSPLPADEQRHAIENMCAEFQQRLDLSTGPVLRIVYFNLGPTTPGRLLFLVHHLASDTFSQHILIEDFLTAYQQLARQQPVQLPPKTASIQQRAERLLAYASSPQLHDELAYWLRLPWSAVTPLPLDYPERINDRPRANKLERRLSQQETRTLLHIGAPSSNNQVQRRLLTALTHVFTSWMHASVLCISLHHHGRMVPFEHLDFTRTVGWLACNPRLLLTVPHASGSLHDLFQSLHAQLKQVPNEGLGYELLRHLSTDEQTIQALKALPGPSLVLDHLGQYSSPGSLRPAPEQTGESSPLSHLWKNDLHMITTEVMDEQLWIQWEYSETVYRRETIEALFEQVLAVLAEMNF